MRQNPYPMSYEGYGAKACPACMDNGGGMVVMKPYWTRGVSDNYASFLYVCERCGHNETAAATVPLSDETKAKMTAPAVQTRFS